MYFIENDNVINIFDLPFPLPNEEIFEPLLSTNNLAIERIISTGQTTPPEQWYDQDKDEWVILLQGEAELSYDDGSRIKLKKGDYLFIKAHQKHRVEYTTSNPPCIWLAIHFFRFQVQRELESGEGETKADN